MKLFRARQGLTVIVLAGCASSPWGDAEIDPDRVFWGTSYERIHEAAVAVARELAPETVRVHPSHGSIRAEGAIGRCGEHAHCARRTPGAGPSRLSTRLRIEFTRRNNSTEVDVFAAYETVQCRGPESPDCQRTGAPSTGELEEEIVRRIRTRVASNP